jgi:hypothetical protein
MSINEFVKTIFHLMISLIFGATISGIIMDHNNEEGITLKTTVFQPEYNHRVDIVTAALVCDTIQSDIYFLWYKNQMFVPNTLLEEY